MKFDPRERRVIVARLARGRGREYFPKDAGRVRKNNVNPWYRRNWQKWDDDGYGYRWKLKYGFDLHREMRTLEFFDY